MARLTLFIVALSCSLYLGKADQCTLACPNNIPTVIVPKDKTTYLYSLEAKTLLNVRDTQKVTIKADVEVSVNGCESVLNLKNAAIEGVPNGEELAKELSAKSLAFGYHNGQVLGMCQAKDDQDWSVNIKKAIASALQMRFDEEQDKVDEIDFSGNCPTEYRRITSKDGVLTMEKRKNLNHCSDRRIDLRQTSDQALGQLKDLLRHHLSLMDNDQVCRFTVKDQVVSSVDCEEKHRLVYRSYKPLQISNLRMDLKETKDGVSDTLGEIESTPKSASLVFEHKHKEASEADTLELLKKLCAQISEDSLNIETSMSFNELIHALQHMDDEKTTNVDEAVKSGSLCAAHPKRLRELFLDASAFASSDGSIRTLVKAHDANELSVSRASVLFSVVALKAAPNGKTIQSLLPIIASEKTIRPFLLGFSVLIRRYCEKTNDCATNADVKDARDAYLARLAVTTDKNDKMNILRAIENLNVQTESTENMISQLDGIVKSGDEPVLRAAAVCALPNDASHMDKYKSLANDESLPNEVRIAAFKKMMKNNGLSNVKEMLDVKGAGMKNYVLSYVDNLKKAKNEKRREGLDTAIELPEQPEMKLGHTRHVAREYGPYTFEYDIIYPNEENVTRSLNAKFTRSTKDKVREIIELQVFQKGFDKELSNVLNVLERKSLQSSIQFLRDVLKFLVNIRKQANEDKHLIVSVKINGKNVIYCDLFQDMKMIRELLEKRLEKIVDEKKVDRTIGALLVDSKVVVPTLNGLPLIYKMGDSFVLHYDGEATGEKGNRNVKFNWSVVASLFGKMKLKVKDQKLGYEYEAKMAYIPKMDMDIVKGDHSLLLRWNIAHLEEKTIMKLKQSLREKRATGEELELDNEITPEERSDKCFTFFLMNYCRNAQKIKGLVYPNVDYVISKPEKEVTAMELEFKGESENEGKTRRYVAMLTAVGSPTGKQAKAEVLITKGEEYKLTVKTPNHEFNTEFTVSADKNHLKMKMDLPHGIKADVTGEFDHDKENNLRKNHIKIEYQVPDEDKTHTVDIENEISYNLKRSSKEKSSNVDLKMKYVSSRYPCFNHKWALQFKYRPFKTNEFNYEFAFGKDFQHRYQIMRNSQMEVEEMRPLKMTGSSDIKLVATGLDINYDLKSEYKYESNKGTPTNLEYKIKGKDLSKRAADLGKDDVEGMIDLKNSGNPVDYKVNANLKVRDQEYAYESEMKQVEPQQYEGKITITHNGKKIFVTHKDELTKPTDVFKLKSDAEVTYSDSDMKKNYHIEFLKEKDEYQLLSNVKRNGETFYENNINLQKGGKLKWFYRRNNRQFDLNLDNVLNVHEGTMLLKIDDRQYDAKLKREPFRYHDIDVVGNDKAYIKQGKLHVSLMDPTTLDVVTVNDGKVNAVLDLISPNTKSAKLKIDSSKYNFNHDGEISVSILNPRLLWKSYTKHDAGEYKLDVDMAKRGSSIQWNRITPEKNNKVIYTRDGEQVNVEVDTDLIEGHVEGTIHEGKIQMKGRQTDFEIESKYHTEDGKIIIEPVKSENGKLEGVLSRRVPSKLTLETPRVKMNLDYDRFAPVKKFKFDFDSPIMERHVDAEYEPSNHYKYHSSGKYKEKNREYHFNIDGQPRKSFNLDMEAYNFKFNMKKMEDNPKAVFSYTFNDYTETDEFDFDPHRDYYINWISAIRKYIRGFIYE